MADMEVLYNQTIDLLEKQSIKYESDHFPSGAIMLDVWYETKFYVLQFQDNFVGVSEVNDENPGFDTIPDEKFYEEIEYMEKLRTLFHHVQ